MRYHDQHVHTYFSFDSEETFENYLTTALPYFVTTDHFDLANPYKNFQDTIPDYPAYLKKIASLKKHVPTHFLTGIELGIVAGQEDKISDYLADKDYDLKLVSIHQNGRFDYMDDIVLTKDKFQVASDYFDNMKRVLSRFNDGHILTHFDYGLRRFDFTVTELQEHFEADLIDILKRVIEKDMAVELNAKSFKTYGNAALYEYFITLYLSLNGKYFSLGSDAHQAKDYELAFPEMKECLRTKGVNELTLFLPNERLQVPF